jgi:hypothetical protein
VYIRIFFVFGKILMNSDYVFKDFVILNIDIEERTSRDEELAQYIIVKSFDIVRILENHGS